MEWLRLVGIAGLLAITACSPGNRRAQLPPRFAQADTKMVVVLDFDQYTPNALNAWLSTFDPADQRTESDDDLIWLGEELRRNGLRMLVMARHSNEHDGRHLALKLDSDADPYLILQGLWQAVQLDEDLTQVPPELVAWDESWYVLDHPDFPVPAVADREYGEVFQTILAREASSMVRFAFVVPDQGPPGELAFLFGAMPWFESLLDLNQISIAYDHRRSLPEVRVVCGFGHEEHAERVALGWPNLRRDLLRQALPAVRFLLSAPPKIDRALRESAEGALAAIDVRQKGRDLRITLGGEVFEWVRHMGTQIAESKAGEPLALSR
ncbi:MAG: hypothetical protein R3F33_11605 [Planctomycetota bacterium]